MSGVGTPTCTRVPGQVARHEGLLHHGGVPDRLDADVGPVAAGERPDRLHRVGRRRRRPCAWRRSDVASSSFFGSRSTAMTVAAPASFDPATAAHPTPPQPKTATESPRPTSPGEHGRPEARHHAAAEQAHRLGPGRGVDLGALARRRPASCRRRRRCRARGRAACRRPASSSAWRCGWRSSTRAGPAGTTGTRRTRPAS